MVTTVRDNSHVRTDDAVRRRGGVAERVYRHGVAPSRDGFHGYGPGNAGLGTCSGRDGMLRVKPLPAILQVAMAVAP